MVNPEDEYSIVQRCGDGKLVIVGTEIAGQESSDFKAAFGEFETLAVLKGAFQNSLPLASQSSPDPPYSPSLSLAHTYRTPTPHYHLPPALPLLHSRPTRSHLLFSRYLRIWYRPRPLCSSPRS